MRWSHIPPIGSRELYEVPLRIAQADIIRARKRCTGERATGMGLGAIGGLTVEAAEADVLLKVCQWRLEMLKKEANEIKPPRARWGGTMTTVGQRAFLIGGWGSISVMSMGIPHKKPAGRAEEEEVGLPLLDLENEYSRRRREEGEFQALLEKERSFAEVQSEFARLETVHMLREKARKQREKEQDEMRRMALEEIRSSVPALSKPAPVRMTAVNETAMWVEWNEVTVDAAGYPMDRTAVTYYLYAKIGYQSLLKGDRVGVI
eukprot:CAMPEP_0119054724 /NCGR_PEP_ID=MMETSP1177-20130426/75264_1 /TAXON_ID=2985 /ORGANISM="Ochromonas sp, Strain CCMP1899" /LENGTH=261 /DNA_ID=CAMNT_0007035063 /DNA_START=236 /DNA_END=1019 /DNA_ORIENTATION=+